MEGTYSCYHYDSDFVRNENTHCWRGLFRKQSGFIVNISLVENKIIVDEKYVDLLVELINEITQCNIIFHKGKKYISYTKFGSYDQDLILLNFIRNLWYSPYPKYSITFFNELEQTDKSMDALQRMTDAHKKACVQTEYGTYKDYRIGHSNCNPSHKLAIKNNKQLKEYTGVSTAEFLSS